MTPHTAAALDRRGSWRAGVRAAQLNKENDGRPGHANRRYSLYRRPAALCSALFAEERGERRFLLAIALHLGHHVSNSQHTTRTSCLFANPGRVPQVKKSTFYLGTFIVGVPLMCCGLVASCQYWYERRLEYEGKHALETGEVGRLYYEYYKDHKKPPIKVDDLRQYAAQHPKGFEAILNGKWVVLWGTQLTDNPRGNADRYVAYSKELPNGYGWVVTGRGAHGTTYEAYVVEKGKIEILHEIYRLYERYRKDHRNPPAALKDIERYEKEFPKAVGAIRDGTWVLAWNTLPTDSIKENYDVVLAYEAKASSLVGWLLTIDGSGIVVTSDYFKDYTAIIPLSHEIWRLYAECAADKQKPPMEFADVAPYRNKYPKAVQAIESGDWIVRWGTPIASDPTRARPRILAYEKGLPTNSMIKGKYAIMTDNFQECMSSSDFIRANEAN
jgi:hypothetical protein